MKKLNFIILAFVMTFLVSSCDPPHFIDLVNTGNGEAIVKIKLDTTQSESYFMEYAEGDAIMIQLAKGETTTIHFGIGVWNEYTVKYTVKSIKSIEIEGATQQATYSTPQEIEQFLLDNIDKKSRIEIKID